MSRSPITIEGNVTGDVRVHTFNDGTSVANFTIAANSSKRNQQTNQYEDTGSQFFDCTAPNHLVEAVVNNLRKGVPVIVSGTLDFRDWTGKEGNTGTAMEIRVDKIGYSIRFHDVQGGRRQHGGGGGGQHGSASSFYGQPQTQQQGYPAAAPAQGGYGQPAQPQGQPAWGQPAAPQAGYGQPPATQQPPAAATSPGNPWGNQPAAQPWNPVANPPAADPFAEEKPF